MVYQILLRVIILITLLKQYNAYKILGIYPFEGRSHFLMFRALNIALVKAGHEVDVISHYPLEKPMKRYNDIVNLSGSRPLFTGNMSFQLAKDIGNDATYFVAQKFGNELCDLMGHEKMKHFMTNLSKNGPYDALITEAFGSNCYLAFGHYFKVPIIVVSTFPEQPWFTFITRNPPALAHSAHGFFENAHLGFDHQYFWTRLQNTFSYFESVYRYLAMTEVQSEMINKYLGPEIPDVRSLEYEIDLTLINTHFSMFGIRPFLPSVVEIAGIHILEDDTKISEDLKKWMDNAVHGVVYFSFGSLINVEEFPKDILRSFFESFKKLRPIKILMKVTRPELLKETIPDNVKILRWIPQIPILRHKNTKLFITHCGLMGTLEALYYGVPMIGIPICSDQPKNAEMFRSKGMMISLAFHEITEISFHKALKTILIDPKYKNSAQRESQLFKDRPLNASETAIYWIEYVIRNGPGSLRSPATTLYWWQNDLLDIYVFCLMILFITLYLCQRLAKMLFKSKSHSRKKKVQ